MTTFAKPVIEYRAMPATEEKRNNLMEQMESMIGKIKMEKRSFSASEQSRFNDIKRQIAEIDRGKAEKTFGNLSNLKSAEEDSEKRMLFEEQKQHLMDYLVKGEMRNLTASGSGGAVVPTEIANFIIDTIVNQSPLLQQCTLINASGDISVPIHDFTQMNAGYITENTDLVEASADFAQVKLTNYIIAGIVKCSRSLVNRTDIDVLTYLTTAMAKNIAYFLEKQLILGTGSSQLTGLTTLGAGQQQTGVTTQVITGDELIDLLAKLPSALADKAVFVMNPVTWANIQKLKATGSGEYLFGGEGQFGLNMGSALLGRPVYVSDSVPVQAVGAKFVYCLDPKSLTVKMTTAIGIQLLNEAFASSYNYGLLGYCECDSKITQAQGIVCLKGK